MPCRRFSSFPFSVIFSIITVSTLSPCLLAQGPAPEASVPAPAVEPVSPVVVAPRKLSGEHKFLDKENFALFAIAAASNTADFAVTRANLQGGGRELNPIVRVFGRSSAGLGVNFAGETASVACVSYFFHRTGHHRMERLAFLVNTGASVGAVSYGLTHRMAAASVVSNPMARHAATFSIRIPIGSR